MGGHVDAGVMNPNEIVAQVEAKKARNLAIAAKQRLADECRRLKEQFGRVPLDELVDFVYAEFPEFTKESRIRHQVAERRERRLGRRGAEYPG